ncbi:MAG TPA: tripartite tricarboxylate transporter substrate-binding protein [Alphaproteobacteria bacterium]|jgi:tripartite-type tricarboxylate transporter receptor subunit TctC
MTRLRKAFPLVGLAVASVAWTASAQAQSPAEFFKGKTVNIEIGFPAGGGYDSYGRVLARHLGRYIPGNPTVVPKNMPGAGALKAANYIYNAAPKDGTEIGIVASSTLMEPLLGNDQAQFDASKFSWLGSMSKDVAFCGITTSSGVASFDDWLKTKKELTFGSSGPAAITHQHPLVMKNVLGANVKLIAGYQGTKDISLAMERKEVDGICGMFISSVQTSYQPMIDAGVMRLIIQMGPVKSDIFGKIPSVYDYAKTDLDRQVLDIHFGQLLLARPFMLPPGVPADRLAALQKAFVDTLKDKALLADAQKAQIEIEAVSPQEVQGMLAKFSDYPQASIKAAQKAIDR